MRIAQVAPLYESVPPRFYGGTERVVCYLTEALLEQGHEVTLFASGDSRTGAPLVASCPQALRLADRDYMPEVWHTLQNEAVFQRAAEFDVLHFHTDVLHLPLLRRHGVAGVTTLHGRLDLPDLAPLFEEFWEAPLVSISQAQRAPLPAANWIATIHHGLPLDLYRPGTGLGGYLAFLGRLSPEKRPDRAIELARRTGMPLKIAAKVDPADRDYFESRVRPLLADPLVEYVGEIGEHEKPRFLGDAAALLFLIDWPEPFGLAMIEANACGTPVIAWPGGSVSEVVRHGENGYLVHSMAEAVRAVETIDRLDRARCRQAFERRFSTERMASDYLAAYRQVMELAAAGYPPDGTGKAELAATV